MIVVGVCRYVSQTPIVKMLKVNLINERGAAMAYFPLFINIENKHCLVVGGGRVAMRKVQILLDFGAQVSTISPVILSEMKQIKEITVMERNFMPEDVKDKILVVAATDDTELNHQIAEFCRKQGILVNVVDQIEDCSFIFPAYVKQKDVVAAFSSSGKSPVVTQYLKAQEEEILTRRIGNINELLGSLRDSVKQLFDTVEERKCFYQEILRLGLEKECIPTEKEVEELIKKYQASKVVDRKEGEEENGSYKAVKEQ